MYRRICENLNDYGKLVPAKDSISKYIKNRNKDYYVSVYKYTEQHKEKFEKDNTVAGIKDVITDTLIFDFDDENNLDNARKDALTLVQRLKSKGVDGYDIFYSGSKGFHVSFQMDKELSPKEAKAVAKELAGDLKSFDTKCYNSNRIIRVANTKHPETGLFKTQISEYELQESTIDEIKDFSSGNYEVVEQESKANISTSFYGFIDGVVSKLQNSTSKPVEVDGKPDLGRNPFKLSPWKLALFQGFYPPGQRNHSLMILAATLRARGLDQEEAYSILKGVNRKQASRYKQDPHPKEELYNNVIEVVYGGNWEGATYSEESFDPKLQEYLIQLGVPRKSEEEQKLIQNIDKGFGDFIDYAENIDKYTVKFGIKSLDNKLKVRKGHLIFLLAPPGVGKTSFGITLLNNTSKQGTNSYFGSYDMYKNNVYQKLIQRHMGINEEELFNIFKKRETKKIEEMRQTLIREYENVTFCFKVGQTINDLKKSIQMEEERLGKEINLVLVDYLELILSDVKDPTAASAEAAQGLREIANEGRVVVGLLQPNKMSSTPNEPLLSYNAAKGSSSIAQAATAIITAHRPGMDSRNNNAEDDFFSVNCVKNRNGPLFSLDFAWDGASQIIREMDDQERFRLRDLRDRKREEKDDDGF